MKELEDYKEFPVLFRNMQTAYIGFAVKLLRIYKPFVEYLKSKPSRFKEVQDLCSGSGQPAIEIFSQTDIFSRLTLSDKFPNTSIPNQENRVYLSDSWDVLNCAFEPKKTYWMFNAFHHFTAEEQVILIDKIVASKSEAYIVEILKPGILSLIQVLLMSTLGVLLLSPFVKPFSFVRLFFTYIIPINLISILIDGVISVFKSKTDKQYQQLFVGIKSDSATLQVFQLGPKLTPLTVIEIKQK